MRIIYSLATYNCRLVRRSRHPLEIHRGESSSWYSIRSCISLKACDCWCFSCTFSSPFRSWIKFYFTVRGSIFFLRPICFDRMSLSGVFRSHMLYLSINLSAKHLCLAYFEPTRDKTLKLSGCKNSFYKGISLMWHEVRR